MRVRIATIFCMLLMPLMIAHADEPELVNAVSFDKGAVLLSYSNEYGGRSSVQWLALGLIDGTETMGWASKKNAAFPHNFLFELARPYAIHSLGFDTRKTEEKGYPGISARDIVVSASTEGRDGPFQEIYRGQIEPGKVTKVNLPKVVEARWLQLSIIGNGGYRQYTELMEFMAYGKSNAPQRSPLNLSATYKTNWNNFYMIAKENELKGCYDYDEGVFNGSKSGDFINIEWRETGPQIGKAVMAITEDGSTFNGFWYEQGKMRGTWFGTLIKDAKKPACAKQLIGKKTSVIEDSLNHTGRAVMYGVYFDYDSDVIKPESHRTLQQVLTWLKANPGKTVSFEGHTDSDGSDTYNQNLSQRRAASVQRWMNIKGIAGQRMTSKGLGESRPVASNATAQGKSLNRRVEIVVVKNK